MMVILWAVMGDRTTELISRQDTRDMEEASLRQMFELLVQLDSTKTPHIHLSESPDEETVRELDLKLEMMQTL